MLLSPTPMYFWEKYALINKFRSHSPAGFYDPIKGHTGEDRGTPMKTPLTLPVKCTVEQILQQNQMGTVLYLKWKSFILVFAHLSSVKVKKGDVVEDDDVLMIIETT